MFDKIFDYFSRYCPTSPQASNRIKFVSNLLICLLHLRNISCAIPSTVNSATMVTFVIDENAPIGHEVGHIHLKDSPTPADGAASPLTFTLQDTSYFNFDPSDPSRLVVRSTLDRDADRKLCTESGWPEVCSWSGVIFVSDGRLLSLRVVVRDTNDNVPRWPSARPQDGPTQLHISVSENCALGTMIDLPLASDPDIGENSIVRYELVRTPGINAMRVPFDVSSANVHNRALYRLVVKGPLDREIQATYHLTVAAVDGGGNQGLAQLTVHVTDENDNKPVFKHLRGPDNISLISDEVKPFVITVDEDVPVGTKLSQHPVATDEDEGDFGRITYAFALSTPDTVKRDFHIDSDTGVLSVRNALDCDTGGLTQYQFVVIAKDHGAPPLTATARVIINVLDKNDNAPVITITSAVVPSSSASDTMDSDSSESGTHMPGSLDSDTKSVVGSERKSSLRLVENTPEGKLIATITVQDSDTEENGKFTCSLGKSDEMQLTYVKNLGKLSVYQLSSTRPVDRESQPELRVTLRCKDHGQPSRSSTELLTVHVVDVNDNAPEFSSKRYSFQTSEGNDIGQLIGVLKATDPDIGRNAQLAYSIQWPPGQGPNPFTISDQGELSARVPLDRESRPEGYQFTVVVHDGGHPVHSSSAQVEVALIDINDCSPVFTQAVYEFAVDEEIPQNATNARVVGQIRATDCDIGNNAQITYHLKPLEAPFKISSNGYISTTSPIDRENFPSFTLTAIAVDSPQPPERQLSSTAEIRILINDQNDHDPVFLRPPFQNMTNEVELSMYEKPGHIITRLEATDEDVGANAAIQFLLVDGSAMEKFKLQPKTGELLLQRELTTRDQGRVKLTVLAVDNGAISRTATTTVHVHIKDIPATPVTKLASPSPSRISSGQPDYPFGSISLFGGTGMISNKFIILCIVLITVVICTILIAVIFVVSRGGCATYLGRSKLLSSKSPEAQYSGQITDGTVLTTPKDGRYPDNCLPGSGTINDRRLHGYVSGSEALHTDSYGLVQPMYTNHTTGTSYEFDQKSHDVMIKNHIGYSGPSLSELERIAGDDREAMSITDFTSTDPFPISSNLLPYTGPTTSSCTMDAIYYRHSMSPFPGQETPLSTVAGLPYSRAADLDGISFTSGLANGGPIGVGNHGLGGGHTFSRFELRNHAINSTGFMNEHVNRNQHHKHSHLSSPWGPPFSPLISGHS